MEVHRLGELHGQGETDLHLAHGAMEAQEPPAPGRLQGEFRHLRPVTIGAWQHGEKGWRHVQCHWGRASVALPKRSRERKGATQRKKMKNLHKFSSTTAMTLGRASRKGRMVVRKRLGPASTTRVKRSEVAR